MDMIVLDSGADMSFLATKTADEIGEMVLNRWNQSWIYMSMDRTRVLQENTFFEKNDRDDISLAIWDRDPISPPS